MVAGASSAGPMCLFPHLKWFPPAVFAPHTGLGNGNYTFYQVQWGMPVEKLRCAVLPSPAAALHTLRTQKKKHLPCTDRVLYAHRHPGGLLHPLRLCGPQLQDRILPLGEGPAGGSHGCSHASAELGRLRCSASNSSGVHSFASVTTAALLRPPLLQLWPIKVLKVAVSFFFEASVIGAAWWLLAPGGTHAAGSSMHISTCYARACRVCALPNAAPASQPVHAAAAHPAGLLHQFPGHLHRVPGLHILPLRPQDQRGEWRGD